MIKNNRIFILVCITFFFLAGYGYYLFNKPIESLKSYQPDQILDANQFLSVFEEDESKANKLFLDKVIQVSGTIEKIENQSIYIKTDNPMSSIIFEMESGQDISLLKSGDTTTIKGLCTGYLMDVVLIRSILLNNQ
jgi:hypothetical protein